MAKNDGGPAFPGDDAERMYCSAGMSLRDWFAGQVLSQQAWVTTSLDSDEIAQHCYMQADAMLLERSRGGE